MKKLRQLLLLVLIAASAGLAHAQGDAPYTEGSVWDITTVKTKAGLQDDYLRQLKTSYVIVMDELKKEDVIVSYKILIGDAATAGDYDVLLMVEFKNFAAFDGQRAKFDAVEKKLLGSAEEQQNVYVKRLEIRDILGDKRMQEVKLK